MSKKCLESETIDPIWEKKYSEGHAEKYPWDMVVSFVFHNAPHDCARSEVRILEVGFGTSISSRFAAREGFTVAGVEGSSSAVKYAQEWFKREQLSGDLRVGDFTQLPFENETFDLVFDREALCCVGKQAHKQAISEVHRVLRNGGKFLFNGYADSHSSLRTGEIGSDEARMNINGGTLVDVGQLYFVSRSEIDEFFNVGWKLHQVQRREWTEMLNAAGGIHAEWMVVAEKTGA